MFGQSRKVVFLVTDAEGVAGICRQDQTDPKDAELRALLTGEINAAVEGFYAGGADEVIVWAARDPHTIDSYDNFVIALFGPQKSGPGSKP